MKKATYNNFILFQVQQNNYYNVILMLFSFQSVISNIANWKYVNKLSLEKCKEFGEWFCHYRAQNKSK